MFHVFEILLFGLFTSIFLKYKGTIDRRKINQHNDTQHNDTQHNNTQHNCKRGPSVIVSMLQISQFSDYAECYSVESHYADGIKTYFH